MQNAPTACQGGVVKVLCALCHILESITGPCWPHSSHVCFKICFLAHNAVHFFSFWLAMQLNWLGICPSPYLKLVWVISTGCYCSDHPVLRKVSQTIRLRIPSALHLCRKLRSRFSFDINICVHCPACMIMSAHGFNACIHEIYVCIHVC